MKQRRSTVPLDDSLPGEASGGPRSGLHLPGVAGEVPVKLVVLDGPDSGLEGLLVEGELGIGGGAQNGLELTDPTVSHEHARLACREGRVLVRDLGSMNGTFVGSTRVHEALVPLGSILRVGQTSIAVQPSWYANEVAPTEATRFGNLVGRSLAMRLVFAILARVAPTDATVLIEGESGTGKELVARVVHDASRRREQPFVVFDCAAVPRELAESELFGHRRGSFSGAVSDRSGAFQAAHGGTLFLDELGELPLELQPKLLRALESGEVRSVGSDAARRVDVRIVAATHRDLHAEQRRGAFRHDLLYRLEIVKVLLPALRRRPEDVPLLVEHLLRGRCDCTALGGPNLAKLMGYSWPGNVRELRNVLDRAVALAHRPDGTAPRFDELVVNVGPSSEAPVSLGPAFPGVDQPMPFKHAKEQLLARFERAYVDALLARHADNLTRAAEAAELSRKHLYELIRRTRGDD